MMNDPRQAFLRERASGVGSSDFGAIFSLPPYGCQRKLWYEKTGAAPDHPFHGNNATARGARMEQIALEVYAEETGVKLLTGLPVKRDPVFDFMLCHADAAVGEGMGAVRPAKMIEVKVPGREMFHKIKAGGLPDAYKLQLQWVMGLWGIAAGEFVIFWADGWELQKYEVRFDPQLFEEMRAAAIEFWRMREVLQKPQKLDPKDPRCGRCQFRRQCQGADLLQLMEGMEEFAGLALPFDGDLGAIVAELWERESVADEATELVSQTRDRLRLALGERVAVETQGARLFFKPQERRNLQRKPLLKRLRELAELAKPWAESSAAGELKRLLHQVSALPETVDKEFTGTSISRPLRVIPA